jgi:prepilin-type N-terminal cleavage/methylation domain-containing protein
MSHIASLFRRSRASGNPGRSTLIDSRQAPTCDVGDSADIACRHPLSKAFTLIELLVVIAIIAILSIVVVLTLNPSEMLRSSRDSNRISDISTLEKAISLYTTDQATQGGGGSLGTINTVYVSLPDPAATTSAGNACISLNLPILPTGYVYHCAGPNYYRNTDTSGWIPLNLKNVSLGSPLSNLPVDPSNTSSSRLYYSYITNGQNYELTATMESQKYKLGGSNDIVSGDGGTLATVYEKGSKLGWLLDV